MKKTLLFAMMILSFTAFRTMGQSGVTAIKSQAIVIDGALDETDWSITNVVNKVISGTTGIDPNGIQFGVAYNADYLYVGLDVYDSLLTQFEMGEIFIDGNNNGGPYDPSDLHLRFAGPFVQVVYPDTIVGVVLDFSVKPLANGYMAELAIPWSELGIIPVPGQQVGFDIIISDGDSGLGFDYAMAWNGGLENYAITSSFGILYFQPENDVTANKAFAINMDGVLNDPEWKVDRLINQVVYGSLNEDPNEIHFGAAYNDQYLYIGLDVWDSTLTPYEMGEIFIDGNNSDGLYDDFDLHLRFAGPFIEVVYPDTISGVILAFGVKPLGNGYTAELAIPWAEMNIVPSAGGTIGLDIMVADRDALVPGVDYVMAWNGNLSDYMATNMFGDLIFHEEKNLTAPQVIEYNIDGILDDPEWNITNVIDKVVNGAVTGDSNDIHFGAAYSPEYLYIGLDVFDAVLSPYEMGEIFIDGNNNGGMYDTCDAYLRFAGPYLQVIYPDTLDGVILQFGVKPLANGYTAELAVPWSELNITPVIGEKIGLDIIITDRDEMTPGMDYMMAWNGGLENYMVTSSFGKMVFGESSAIGDPSGFNSPVTLFPNPSNGDVNILINPESLQGKLTVQVTDMSGRTVLVKNYDVIQENPIRLDGSSIKSGMYFVTLKDDAGRSSVSKLIIQ